MMADILANLGSFVLEKKEEAAPAIRAVQAITKHI